MVPFFLWTFPPLKLASPSSLFLFVFQPGLFLLVLIWHYDESSGVLERGQIAVPPRGVRGFSPGCLDDVEPGKVRLTLRSDL